MADVAAVKEWMARRAAADDCLYERYGQALETQHAGEFVAIGDNGEMITGADEFTVAAQAVDQFGPGAFVLRRIGSDAEVRWRRAAR